MSKKDTEGVGRDTVAVINNFHNLANSSILGEGGCFDCDGNISDIQDTRRDPARTSWIDADIDFLGVSIQEFIPENKHRSNKKDELNRLIDEQALDMA